MSPNVYATPTEHVVNGNFETGTLAGWTLVNSGSGTWTINDGTFVPPGPLGTKPPIDGKFDAMSIQGGPGMHLLSQPFTVPLGITSAKISWKDRIFNWAAVFSNPNQQARVQITDASGTTVLATIFSTNPGDPLIQPGPNTRSFDITALMQSLAGKTVAVSLQEQDNLFFFNWIIDDVSLTTDTGVVSPVGGTIIPVDMTALFVAGVMTNAFWMVPTLGGIAGAAIALFKVKRKHN